MNKYENIINTLRCQINRAQEKKNLIKADKLKKKLSEVNNLHKMAQKKKAKKAKSKTTRNVAKTRASTKSNEPKYVYDFGNKTDGDAKQ